MKENSKGWGGRITARGVVLAVLGVVTLGVAVLSVAVSYDILEPRFGGWAVPTVGALDALWVVFQATEILAGNNRRRAWRVQYAGLALTVVNAAIPTADLILSRSQPGIDLAVVLTPIAIVFTKLAWWIALPSLGRRVSAGTRQSLESKRQTVADKLEEMEAEAAHRIELLELATALEEKVAKAETAYRKGVLKAQHTMTKELHGQAETTAATVAEKVLPASVAAIGLPELGQWSAVAPALPSTPDGDRHGSGTQVNALPTGTGTPGVPPSGTPAHPTGTPTVTLADLAAVSGVPVPEPGRPLTDEQLDVVLRHLRYADDPPRSYRQARDAFRRAGFVGSEARVRIAFGSLLAQEDGGGETFEDEEESEDTSA
ncbi:hypothetical protein OOK13_43505 [Streptomyces sp. NBC_00378]|uniref:hypothetical protein n=1 Tax=unclassified Streptomyces TaxID=2593676 RepID=UPI0022508EE9|nr:MULTISPECIES: hypothetical protein [unclassified Streptomyces]MCX5115197.1 hypothetical protein [Streptomyces sp. NBC_00378]